VPKRNVPLNVMSIDKGGMAYALQGAIDRAVGDLEARETVEDPRVVTLKLDVTRDSHGFLKLGYQVGLKVPAVRGKAVAFPDEADGYVVDGAVTGPDGQLDLEAALHFDDAHRKHTNTQAAARGQH